MPAMGCNRCGDDIELVFERVDSGDGPWAQSGWTGYVLWDTPDDGGDGCRLTCGNEQAEIALTAEISGQQDASQVAAALFVEARALVTEHLRGSPSEAVQRALETREEREAREVKQQAQQARARFAAAVDDDRGNDDDDDDDDDDLLASSPF